MYAKKRILITTYHCNSLLIFLNYNKYISDTILMKKCYKWNWEKKKYPVVLRRTPFDGVLSASRITGLETCSNHLVGVVRYVGCPRFSLQHVQHKMLPDHKNRKQNPAKFFTSTAIFVSFLMQSMTLFIDPETSTSRSVESGNISLATWIFAPVFCERFAKKNQLSHKFK